MKSIFILFAVSSIFFSCERESDEQVNTLGSAVRFSLAEYPGAYQNNLTLKFLTSKDFPCINYQISQQMEQAGNQITISLQKIEKADVCLDASGPATAFVDLKNLAEGNYNLTINIGKSMSSLGKLMVTDKAYELDMEASEDLLIDQPVLRRIPDRVIWGTVRYTNQQQTQELRTVLLNSLRNAGAAEKSLPEGDYYYFDVDAVGKLKIDSEGAENTFLMEFGGSDDQLASILKQVEQTYGAQASVRIYNTAGDEFSTSSF